MRVVGYCTRTEVGRTSLYVGRSGVLNFDCCVRVVGGRSVIGRDQPADASFFLRRRPSLSPQSLSSFSFEDITFY